MTCAVQSAASSRSYRISSRSLRYRRKRVRAQITHLRRRQMRASRHAYEQRALLLRFCWFERYRRNVANDMRHAQTS